MIAFITVLKAIAAAFIANSHFKGVYPTDIMSFGGGFGLGLFYMVSGYLLANIKSETSFIKWYLKRIVRLYIPLYIWRLITILIGVTEIGNLKDFIMLFIFPGTWFGASMLLLYPIYYVFVKYIYAKYKNKSIYFSTGIFALVFLALFIIKPSISTFSLQSLQIEEKFSVETVYFITQFIWITCMLIGFAMRKSLLLANKGYILLGTNIICLGLFLLIRLLRTRGG